MRRIAEYVNFTNGGKMLVGRCAHRRPTSCALINKYWPTGQNGRLAHTHTQTHKRHHLSIPSSFCFLLSCCLFCWKFNDRRRDANGDEKIRYQNKRIDRLLSSLIDTFFSAVVTRSKRTISDGHFLFIFSTLRRWLFLLLPCRRPSRLGCRQCFWTICYPLATLV